LHGHGGEWRVEKPRVSWEILNAFREAAKESGIPYSDDFNRGDNFGCGYFEVNQKEGVRWNASKAFLHPIRSRPNLTVMTGAQVDSLILEQTQGASKPLAVRGVRFSISANGSSERRSALLRKDVADAEVVMAAGAIGTPQILELSGIGDAKVLQAAGVDVRLDEPGVGANLQDHLQLRMIYKVSNVHTLNRQANSLFGKAWMGLQYVFFKRGPMTMSPSQLGAFTKSDPGQASANLEFHVQPLSLDKFGEPLHRFPAMTASVCNLRPQSRGTTHLRSRESSVAPLIAPGYLSNDSDIKVAANSIRVTRKIMQAAALAQYSPTEYLPGPAFNTESELATAASQIGTTIFHPVGTAKMGVLSDVLSVVDARLRAHRVSGLRIADASVMPNITSGNTNSPTLMIAERAAEWMLQGN
jgi:choline dehydrogenase